MIDQREHTGKRGNQYPQFFSDGRMVGCGCDEAKAVHVEKYNFKPCHHMNDYNQRSILGEDLIPHVEDELRGSCCTCGKDTKGVICGRCLE